VLALEAAAAESVDPFGIALHQVDAARSRSARIDEQRADPLVGVAGEVADHRQADRAPVRAIPVERHPDPGALQTIAGWNACRPRDRGTHRARRAGRSGPAGNRVAGQERDHAASGQDGGDKQFVYGSHEGPRSR
jgi:hypothetical protein